VLKILGSGVFRAVDDTEVFAAEACHGGLTMPRRPFATKSRGSRPSLRRHGQ
jgi:hypothetical protein